MTVEDLKNRAKDISNVEFELDGDDDNDTISDIDILKSIAVTLMESTEAMYAEMAKVRTMMWCLAVVTLISFMINFLR